MAALFMGAIGLAGPIACAALLGVDDTSYAAPDGASSDAVFEVVDGPLVDDVADAAASDADACNPISAGGPNLLTNGGFENGNGGCGIGWTADGTLYRSPDSHSVCWACYFCRGANATVTLSTTAAGLDASIAPGESYSIEAFVSVPADAGGPALALPAFSVAGSLPRYGPGQSVPAGSGWIKVSFAYAYDGDAAGSLGAGVGIQTAPCVLIDDVTVIKQ
jgi:hypothetical protein